MKVFIASLLISSFIGVLVSAPVSAAFDPFADVCEGSATNSSVCTEVKETKGKNPFDGSSGIIPTIANFMAAIGGLIAVVTIMVSGLRMITSSGDSAKINQSRNAIIYAAAGIVVIVLARTILWFVISKL